MNNPFAYLMFLALFRNGGFGFDGNGAAATTQGVETQAQLNAIRTQLQDNQNAECIKSAVQGNGFALSQLAQTLNLGNPVLNGTTVFVPITAYVQITVPGKCGCAADVIPYTGHFEVAFQGRTTLPTTAPTIDSVGTQQSLAYVNNGEACGYVINDSIVVSIGAASSVS